MSILNRIWKRNLLTNTTWTIWDSGNEFWEMKEDCIRHFSILDRRMDGECLRESVIQLKDSPIPLEALRQEIQGWEVVEESSPASASPPAPPAPLAPAPPAPASPPAPVRVLAKQEQKPLSQKKPLFLPEVSPFVKQGPAFLPDTPEDVSQPYLSPEHKERTEKKMKISSRSSASSASSGSSTSSKVVKKCLQEPSEKETSHEKPLQQDSNSQEEPFSQHSYTLVSEPWYSLSQWIPPYALYQPSLNYQSLFELSHIQGDTYLPQSNLEKNSQQSQDQRQYVKPVQQSKPYFPKPSQRTVKVSPGPLFL